MEPLFSVLIPVFNSEKLVSQTIDSVLSQTYKNYELIVVDDGSSDGSKNVLESYRDSLQAHFQCHQGAEAARNNAAAAAKGEYLVFLDHDDLLLPYALATYQSIIAKFEVPLIIGNMLYFENQFDLKNEIAQPCESEVFIFDDYLSKSVTVAISFSIIVIRKDLFERVGGLKGGDDYSFMLSIGTFGPCAIIKSPKSVAHRMHAGNWHKNLAQMIEILRLIIQKESRGEYPGGWQRSLDRKAYIGGIAWTWVRYAYRGRQPFLAAKLLVRYGLMIAMGALRKLCKSKTAPSRVQVPLPTK